MKPLRTKLEAECKSKQVDLHVIEIDYALSYILAGIAKQPELANSLIFKGGTALKKIFFGDYRFSEDLDFSVINAPKEKLLEVALNDAIDISKKLLNQYGAFDLQLKRYTERAPHPHGQEAFVVIVKFPWHPTHLCRIKVEITHDEPVVLPPVYKPILHNYEEELDCVVACYNIEEVIAEKLRALLQTHRNLIERGWNRPRARDYYDLWSILRNYSKHIDEQRVLETLQKKCQHRNVTWSNIDDFFTSELTQEANKHWQATLGFFIKDLPKCNLVLDETRSLIEVLITKN